jgi:hypothetical protein
MELVQQLMHDGIDRVPDRVDPDVPPNLHPVQPFALDIAGQGGIFDDAARSELRPDTHEERWARLLPAHGVYISIRPAPPRHMTAGVR